MLVKVPRPNHFKILDVATRLAIEHGLDRTYVSMIAKEMNSHHSLLYTYYTSMKELRSKIIEKALNEDIAEIILEAVLSKRISRSDLSESMRQKINIMIENGEY